MAIDPITESSLVFNVFPCFQKPRLYSHIFPNPMPNTARRQPGGDRPDHGAHPPQVETARSGGCDSQLATLRLNCVRSCGYQKLKAQLERGLPHTRLVHYTHRITANTVATAITFIRSCASTLHIITAITHTLSSHTIAAAHLPESGGHPLKLPDPRDAHNHTRLRHGHGSQ